MLHCRLTKQGFRNVSQCAHFSSDLVFQVRDQIFSVKSEDQELITLEHLYVGMPGAFED